MMVEGLKAKGVVDPAVLAAMESVPRHVFLDGAYDKIAYDDRAIEIGADQTISRPSTVAFQTQLLQLSGKERVLEIGTGSLYQTMVLTHLAMTIYTIERQKALFDRSKALLLSKFPTKQLKIKMSYGDGFVGFPNIGNFDRILITAAAPMIPPRLIDQLVEGGIMVLPLDQGNQQTMLRLTKLSDGTLREEWFSNFKFVPMLQGRQTVEPNPFSPRLNKRNR